MHVRAKLIATAMLMGLALALAGASGSAAAAPAHGLMAGAADVSSLLDARHSRRRGRACYRKCYREFVIGRRVCRTYCPPF